MRGSSWCNARPARFGSMVSAWDSNPSNSCTTTTTTANNADPSYITNFSSMRPSLSSPRRTDPCLPRRKLSKKARHPSANSHHNPLSAASRVSRSHSPVHSSKPAKRRNTMNSRDAAFDESLKELIEATAAEAAAAQDTRSVTSNGNANGVSEPQEESVPSNRKKRKRLDEDV